MARPLRQIALCLLALLAASGALGAWPMERGNPQRTGVADSPLAPPLRRAWRFQAEGHIEAEPVFSPGRAWVATDRGRIYALSLDDGAPVWQASSPNGFAASPCVEGDRLYLADNAGVVRCLDTATSRALWVYQTDDEIQSSPVVADGRLYVGSYDQRLHCIDAASGVRVWAARAEGPVHCSPALTESLVLIAGCDERLRAFDRQTGDEVWDLKMGGLAAGAPVVAPPAVYVANFAPEVLSATLADGDLRWRRPNDIDQPFYASCAVAGDRVIATGRDKRVHCLSAEKGDILWRTGVKGQIEAGAAVASDTVYVGSKGGVLYALDLKDGRQVWHYVNGAPYMAGPGIDQGHLVAGDVRGVVTCFISQGEKKP